MGLLRKKNIRDIALSMTVQLASLESCTVTFSGMLKEKITNVPKSTNSLAMLELLRPKLRELKLAQANVELSIKELEDVMNNKKKWD